MIGYACAACGERHDGLPVGYRIPLSDVADARKQVCFEGDGELCYVGDDRFILANIELPIAGTSGGLFIWTCWMSLSPASYERFKVSWKSSRRQFEESAFGWLFKDLPAYEPAHC